MIAYLLLHLARKVIPNKRTLQQLVRLVAVNNILHRRSILQLLVDPGAARKTENVSNQRQLDLINA